MFSVLLMHFEDVFQKSGHWIEVKDYQVTVNKLVY